MELSLWSCRGSVGQVEKAGQDGEDGTATAAPLVTLLLAWDA
jgi:hypothetical protein